MSGVLTLGLAGQTGTVTLDGDVNTSTAEVASHIASAIRRGLPQVWPQPMNPHVVALVGGGPSLAETADALREAVWRGAKLVTLNGAYRWCIERNLKPVAQIVLDARASNARFVDPPVPDCRYYLASQCHPDVFDALKGRPHVGVWHAVANEETALGAVLKAYYLDHWLPIPGGTTVAMRALMLLRTMGYLRFELFGIDSCWLDGAHHAFPQPENDQDRRVRVTVAPEDRLDLAREFICAPWHAKQLEDFLQTMQANGHEFKVRIHGRGLLAWVLESAAMSASGQAAISVTKE